MNVHRLKINSSPDCIKIVKNWIDDIAMNYGICEELYPDILISMTEAVNNAIHHGNRGDESKKIILVCRIKEKKLKFEVLDEGEGFNPDIIPDPRSEEKIETENGRGVLIMRSLASKVEFKKKGSKVEITFKYKR